MRVPFISIIIPAYNSEKTIGKSIESVLSQSFTDFRILIVDGASTDNTINSIRDYSERDKRIEFVSEKDKGIYDAMNKGIELSNGEWLYFLGSDDELYDRNVLEDICGNANSDQCNILYGDVKLVGDTSWAKDGENYDGLFDLRKLFKKNICHQSIFYRRNFVKKSIGYFNTEYSLCADWDFNLRCRAKTNFIYVPKIIASFYGGGKSTNNYEDKNFSKDFLQNILAYFNITVFDPLVDDIHFPHYHEVLLLQKKRNYLRYLAGKVKKKVF